MSGFVFLVFFVIRTRNESPGRYVFHSRFQKGSSGGIFVRGYLAPGSHPPRLAVRFRHASYCLHHRFLHLYIRTVITVPPHIRKLFFLKMCDKTSLKHYKGGYLCMSRLFSIYLKSQESQGDRSPDSLLNHWICPLDFLVSVFTLPIIFN